MTTNQPIPLETLRKAVQRAKELEGKATKGPWAQDDDCFVFSTTEAVKNESGGTNNAWVCDTDQMREKSGADMDIICLSRSLLPAVLETLSEYLVYFDACGEDRVPFTSKIYPPAAALVRWYESEGREVSHG